MDDTIEISEHDFDQVNHAAGVFGMMTGLKIAKKVLKLAADGDLDGARKVVQEFAVKVVKVAETGGKK